MRWHTVVATREELRVVLGTIRKAGGVVTGSRPCAAGFLVTYVAPR